MAVIVSRRGDEYTARATPPEVQEPWETDRPYGRGELRRMIEDLGVHPVDVADAFFKPTGALARSPQSTSRAATTETLL